MKDQHTKITGYRDLTQAEIDAMNHIKAHGQQLEGLVAQIKALPGVCPRWVAIATTDLQTGLMALTRAVARPTSF